MINKFIFTKSRNFPPKARDILHLTYYTYIKLKHLFQYQKSMFEYVNIETNSECNLKCSYCPNSKYNRAKGELDLKTIKKIASQLKQLKFKGLVFLTGYNEPMQDNRILEILSILRTKLPKNKILIYTNGTKLTPKEIETIENLNIILNITLHEEKLNQKTVIPHIKNSIIRKNISNLPLSTRGGLVEVNKHQKKKFCLHPLIELTIDYMGNAILCCDDYFSKYHFGNVKTTSLYKIWIDKKFKETRKNIIYNKNRYNICKNC